MIMKKIALGWLVMGHMSLLIMSNLLVQYPIKILGLHTTWGAFSYPLIFILTDLTTRLLNAKIARKVIFLSMFPGLLMSYFIASVTGLGDAFMALRIAVACFIAYVVGQLLDIMVFQRYRAEGAWWLAPALSTTVGSFVDTFLFFSIAFYHCQHPFLSVHWVEIAVVDMIFKMLISLLAFVPTYGIILSFFSKTRQGSYLSTSS